MGITLYYFNSRGMAEPIRMILSYGGEKFEDVRIQNFPLPEEYKAKCTWGQVPLVEFDGKKLAQSLAITRYFAKKHGLVPKDDFEAALADEYVDAIRDFVNLWRPIFMEQDEAKQKEKIKEVLPESKTRFLSVFNSILEKNGTYLVGKSLTWADICIAHFMNTYKIAFEVDLTADFPALKAHTETVFAVPSIKAWVDQRPETRF